MPIWIRGCVLPALECTYNRVKGSCIFVTGSNAAWDLSPANQEHDDNSDCCQNSMIISFITAFLCGWSTILKILFQDPWGGQGWVSLSWKSREIKWQAGSTHSWPCAICHRQPHGFLVRMCKDQWVPVRWGESIYVCLDPYALWRNMHVLGSVCWNTGVLFEGMEFGMGVIPLVFPPSEWGFCPAIPWDIITTIQAGSHIN